MLCYRITSVDIIFNFTLLITGGGFLVSASACILTIIATILCTIARTLLHRVEC